MQKVFNTLAGLSFLMSGAVLGAGRLWLHAIANAETASNRRS